MEQGTVGAMTKVTAPEASSLGSGSDLLRRPQAALAQRHKDSTETSFNTNLSASRFTLSHKMESSM